nr:15728_t:CDS:2 [Entrophospora candida]
MTLTHREAKEQKLEILFPPPLLHSFSNPQESFFSNTSYSPFSPNLLTEDLVSKVIDVLSSTLDEIKNEIWKTFLNPNEGKDQIPKGFISDFNKLISKTPFSQYPNVQRQPIKNLQHLISILSVGIHSPETELIHQVFDFYNQITAFLTVIHMFFEVVVMDFLSKADSDKNSRRLEMDHFMRIFHFKDNFLDKQFQSQRSEDEDKTNESLDSYTWYYHKNVYEKDFYHLDLSRRFQSLSIRFNTLETIESILSFFYTRNFLNTTAKEHQKDHGQFYTPKEVIKFMWDRVFISRENQTWIEKLFVFNKIPSNGNSSTSSDAFIHHQNRNYDNKRKSPHHHHNDHNINSSSESWEFLPNAPMVLDPCMGIGSFLCEFINRVILAAKQTPSIWNNPNAISNLIKSLAKNIWGIEIDSFAFHLCKLNIILHLLPLYKQFKDNPPFTKVLKLDRLHLFCNDTLNLFLPKREHTWEYDNLRLLRSPHNLKFDFIVTNPPYMIRKTGFISEPDIELFDERVLGKGGMQAYAYFFWFCVERCREETGEICLISASQWMSLEFADKLRFWMWDKCYFVEFFQFEPFKVWRKIQTDSLIFRLRRRSESIISNGSPNIGLSITANNKDDNANDILFLRYMNRKASLKETLQAYANFDASKPQFDKDMHHKITKPFKLSHQNNSFSFTFLMPTSAVSAYLHSITMNFPSLCDHSSMKPTWLECNPLIWHRGPNTNPVYALVVRTSWAYSKFGVDICREWLKPVFYWNGKNGGKEADFWKKMGDELRLEKKENSPAEAYVPFISHNAGGATISKNGLEQDKSMYSLIMVDRNAIEKIRSNHTEDSPFWIYLKEARKCLQTTMTTREVVYCGTSKCGLVIP